MAKFLTTVGNSYYIEQIIMNSTDSLTLVTPYLKLSKNLLERLFDADKQGIKITLIYGKSELHEDEKEKLYCFKNIEIYFCDHLHAKCYFNDTSMIITSMNLYEFSERNNREMGLLIQKEIDSDIFRDTLKEIESIKNSSQLKKSLDKEKDSKDSLYTMEEGYDEQWNFHLPSLQKILNSKFPSFTTNLDNEIYIENFPKEKVSMSASYRINFHFDYDSEYKKFKKLHMKEIDETLKQYRIYWNISVANIYLEENYTPPLNQQGLQDMTRKFTEIIETFYKFLS